MTAAAAAAAAAVNQEFVLYDLNLNGRDDLFLYNLWPNNQRPRRTVKYTKL